MQRTRVTLEQWRAALAVADEGGFAAAARSLAKSQSSVSHAVARLQEQLGVPLFRLAGRRAELTAAGHALLRRARYLLRDALALEETAQVLAQGWEAEVTVAVDTIVPMALLLRGLERFAAQAPETRVQVMETVLSGTEEALGQGGADLALGGLHVPGFHSRPLGEVEMIAVAHRDHALHRLAEVSYADLKHQRQLVVRDSGMARYDVGWLEPEQRWTFSSLNSSIEALRQGSGFAWVPRDKIARDLEEGLLRPLPLAEGGRRWAPLHLYYRDREGAGPATLALAEALL
ncbi:MAG: LysR family transcriptional regulator [Alphaproteobacteria bacterium]|nr:LysR family transcriptional regulator [Alphaproteobacteria bacterium]HJP20114.1 LysR family transcriptional regulator [Alphaproteobacteria bacterium]